jgi:hypothetical protein
LRQWGSYTPWLGFPTPAYLPQYVSFLIGTLAARGNWFERVPALWGKVAAGIAIVATIAPLPIALTGEASFHPWSLTFTANFEAPGHWQSGIYASWDAVLSVSMACS